MTDNPTRQSAEVRYFICDGGGERIDWIVGAIGDQKCATHPLAFLRGPFREQSADHPAVETPTKADWVPTCRVAGCPNGVLNDGDGCSQHPPAVETPTEPMDRFCWCNHPFAVHAKGGDPRFQTVFCDECNHIECKRTQDGIGVSHSPAEQLPAAERRRRDQSHDRVVVGDMPCSTCGGTDWICAEAAEQRIKELEGRHHLDQAQVKIVCERIRTLEEKLTAAEMLLAEAHDFTQSFHGESVTTAIALALGQRIRESKAAHRYLEMERDLRTARHERLEAIAALTDAEKERDTLNAIYDVTNNERMAALDEKFALQSSLHAAEEKIAEVTKERDNAQRDYGTALAVAAEFRDATHRLDDENESLRADGFSVQFMEWYPRIAQLLDGWHADGTAWSEYDESVRRELTRLGALAAAKMEKGS